ncbi:MAG: hypothetical protein VX701_02955 [Chloroflexota bacterium]|nr:hypothetical protein [Chloroflexota bacterium]
MAKPQIAAIVTTYFQNSHADLIVSKFAEGFPSEDGLVPPDVNIVSMYMDQLHNKDVGMQIARDNDIEVFPSIRAALTLETGSEDHWPTADDWKEGDLSVDGVILIGEHGDYPHNERDRRLYPRRNMFEQICGVFSGSGKSVPVFNDKHLSYSWDDAVWMYNRAKELQIPLMAGSSLPVIRRHPELEHELDTNIVEALQIGYINSYKTGLDSYGFHGLEALQCMVERRYGAETGIASVQCLEGEEVWRAGEDGLWSIELADAAEAVIDQKQTGLRTDNCRNPTVFILEYIDGLRAASLILPGHLQGWGYAAKVGGGIDVTSFNTDDGLDFPFGYLGLNIQEMFVTGVPQYPVERTLLVTGALEALMESRYLGHVRLETPHLNLRYKPYDSQCIRPRNPR